MRPKLDLTPEERRARKRAQNRASEERVRGGISRPHDGRPPTYYPTPPAEVLEEAARAYAVDPPLMGDPPRGRSSLEKIRALVAKAESPKSNLIIHISPELRRNICGND